MLLGQYLVAAGSDGWVEVRSVGTGALRCSVKTAVGYDRSGPTRAGELIVFANIHGDIMAVPVADVLRCAVGT